MSASGEILGGIMSNLPKTNFSYASLLGLAPVARVAPAEASAAQIAQHQPQQPLIREPLNTPQKLQAYLNSLPPGTELELENRQITSLAGVHFPYLEPYLYLNNNQITSLMGVQFPAGLTTLVLDNNKIGTLKGVQFPPSLLELNLNDNPLTSLTGVQFPSGLKTLVMIKNEITTLAGVQFPPNLLDFSLSESKITSLRGVQFPPSLLELDLSENKINTLTGAIFPPSLVRLYLSDNEIKSLTGVQFPPGLTLLNLDNNKITSLTGVQFPPSLLDLILSYNEIKSLTGLQFPPGLTLLRLEDNKINTLKGVQFPPSLLKLNLSNNNLHSLEGLQIPEQTTIELKGNPLVTLNYIVNPNKYLIDYLKYNFPSLYFRDLHAQHKGAQMAEKSSLKTARKEMSDLTQQSMQNQLKAVTSFLREGMEARARQHEEQVKKDNEEGKIRVFFVRFNGKIYHVPLNMTMTIQAVLDYLNSHYYISALEDCGVMQLVFSGNRLEPERTLADCNVQMESTLYLVCKFTPNLFQGGSKKRTIKPRNKRSKSKSKSTKKRT